ncbi:MAG: dCTP deaminase [Nitrososphaerales archaeon]|nr:dCTP deaminase [Nitrososphaerales archaeon]
MILSHSEINRCIKEGRLVVEPFDKSIVRENGIDLRLGNEIARLRNTDVVFDVHGNNRMEEFFERESNDSFVINPGERVLVCTFEYIELQSDLMGFLNLRSSYARVGLSLPPTVIDAGFRGQLTLYFMGGSFPIMLYAGDRFCHVVLAKLTSDSIRYRGTYLGQRGVTYPKF